MARPSQKTPTKLALIRKLHAEKMPVREIAKQAGVSVGTAAAWLKEDASSSASTRPPKPAKAAAPEVASIEAIMSVPLPTRDDPEALVKVRERAALIQDLLVDLTQAVKDEEYPATSFVTLARYGDDLATRIAELSPPAPKDPNEDPDVIESERILISRLNKLVTEAEKRR